MEIVGVVSLVIIVAFLLIGIALGIFLYSSRKLLLYPVIARGIIWLADKGFCFDNVPEGYVARYESGNAADGNTAKGKFVALACSYGEFGPVKAPGDLDWAIRRVGETDTWLAWKDADGTDHPQELHTYTKEDFRWDRRLSFIKKIFGEDTGIVWMGMWPMVGVRYYKLRISNFRTVRPDEDEIKSKNASVREYTAGGNTKENIAGYLVSWNTWTKDGLLSDDNFPIPVDGVRIGVSSKDGKKQQGVGANILVIIRARICEPRLYFYRVQNGLETIDNEMIQHVRRLCANMTIEEVYTLNTTLESDDVDQNNPILKTNGFGDYIRKRYGIKLKGASFAYVTLLGTAAEALSAPYIAQQNADAAVIRGRGEGESEKQRLILVAEGFAESEKTIGAEATRALRAADVATAFAESGKASTVLLGFDFNNLLGSAAKTITGTLLPSETGDGKEKK